MLRQRRALRRAMKQSHKIAKQARRDIRMIAQLSDDQPPTRLARVELRTQRAASVAGSVVMIAQAVVSLRQLHREFFQPPNINPENRQDDPS